MKYQVTSTTLEDELEWTADFVQLLITNIVVYTVTHGMVFN